jgi:hypothetical protein
MHFPWLRNANVFRAAQLGSLVLMLNGCSDDDGPNFTYGKGEMEGVVVGTWAGTWTVPGADPSALTLEIRSGSKPGSLEPACNDRVLSSSGYPGLHVSCESASVLRVSGALSVADGSWDETSLTGEYAIWSLNLDPGTLMLANADETLRLSADQDDGGAWRDCRAMAGDFEIACTLDARR